MKIGATLFLLAYFFLFAGNGLWASFSGDDLMNLHWYWSQGLRQILQSNVLYWSTAYRPLGGLFYLGLYDLFGFHPLPFRIVCYLLLLANLALTYHFTKALSRSCEVAALATLLVTYHAWFVDLYYSSGTVYELLCFFFYFTAFLYYVRIRQAGSPLSRGQWVRFCLLYVCSLNSKEMAVTLPLFLGIYEALFWPPAGRLNDWWRWVGNEGRGMMLTGATTIPYVIGKLAGEGSLVENPAYRPQISAGRFLDAFHLYLNPLLYQEHFFRDPNTVQLLLLMLAFALWQKSRALLFAWFFLLLSVLPFIFLPHYAAFFLYIPSVGWALYLASILVKLQHAISRRLSAVSFGRWQGTTRAGGPVAPILTFLLLAGTLAQAHRTESPKTLRLFASVQPPTREMSRELVRVQPTLPAGSRVLFLDDPFPPGEYWLLFLMRLFYRDLSLEIGRKKANAVPPADAGEYDLVFAYQNGRLVRFPAPPASP